MQKFNSIPTPDQVEEERLARIEDARKDAEFVPAAVQEKPALSEAQQRNREQFFSDRHAKQMSDLLHHIRK